MATGVAGMDRRIEHQAKGWSVAAGILALVAAYGVAALLGFPQYGTKLVVNGLQQTQPDEHAAESTGVAATSTHRTTPNQDSLHTARTNTAPPIYAVTPFVLLLAAIALFPLFPLTAHWWESNLNRLKVAAGLGLVTLAYYGFLHDMPVDGHWPTHYVTHPAESTLQWGFIQAILGNALLQEYIPFIVLLFSLYTISGGIRIEGDLRANPMTNATFMGIGAVLASFIGTTGAAMLLIRPLLDTNDERKHVVHTVIFFIFVVCNCGGCLLPIGDPPLFLGYLEGVDFWWTLRLWEPWLFVNGLLIGTYLVLDEFWFYRSETGADIGRDVSRTRALKITGWKVNAPLLIGVILAVALLDPKKALPGTDWHPWIYMREIVQLGLVATSLSLGSRQVRVANRFNYHAILEVAALFIGIFVCMQPALEILGIHGGDLGISTPAHFFWVTGGLSSVLDNAPTYLVFFKTAQAMGDGGAASVAGVAEPVLVAISLGAVFMGAMTYIGNGPNFMVKAISEKAGVRMPSFFAYMMYSCLILLPILALCVWRYLM